MADRFTARLVAGACVLLTGLTLWYVLTYGPNAPFADEWGLVRYLTGRANILDLMGGLHNEHRYPLGQLAWYAVENAAGYDLRAGMVVNVLLMSATAGMLVRAVSRATGRSSWGDLLFPALLLNFGHDDNWLLSYQIVLTLPLAAVGGVLATAVTLRDGGETRAAAVSGTLTLVALNAGAYALAIGPPLIAWTMYLVVRAWRRRELSWTAAGLVVPCLAAVGYLGFCLGTWPGSSERTPVGPARTAEAFLRLLGYTFGGGIGARSHPWAGVLVLALDVAVLIRIGRVLARDSVERPRALGVLAVWAAMLGVGAGLTLTRAVFADRYALPLALHGCAAVAVFRLYPVAAGGRVAPVLAAALAVAAVVGNWQPGIAFGELRRYMYREIRADIEAGMPVRFLAERHAAHLLSIVPNRVEHLSRWTDELREDRVGWFARARPTPGMTELPALAFGPLVVPLGGPSAPLPGPGRAVLGARVEVRSDAPVFGLLVLEWPTTAGRAPPSVYLLCESGQSQTVLLWVNDSPGEVRFRLVGTVAPVTVTRLEWLVTSPPH